MKTFWKRVTQYYHHWLSHNIKFHWWILVLDTQYLCNSPMLLQIIWTYLEMELTCKNLGKNSKNWAKFWDFEILRNWDFASPWHTEIPITLSIFEIESSSFGFSFVFMCFEIHVLQLRLYDQFCNDLKIWKQILLIKSIFDIKEKSTSFKWR